MAADVRLIRAANGELTATVDGKHAHSRHNPSREASRATAETVRREPPCVVILGSGLGYHVRPIVDETSQTHVIAVEPLQALCDAGIRDGALAGLATNPRVSIVRTANELTSALNYRARSGFEVLAVRPDAEELAEARDAVRGFADRLDINRNTLRKFGRLWVRNLTRNVKHLAEARGVDSLAGAFTGVPALLLAAGPTLDQILPALPELAKRTLVIAVDTAIRPAIDAGVEPDIAVVVDPQYWNSRHLDRVQPGSTILVSEPATHPSTFRGFVQPYVLCSSLFPLGAAFEEVLGTFGTLGAGGSVATTAWDLARLLDCSAVFTAGLDLGFPDSRTHVQGSFFEHLCVAIGSRTATAESVVFRYTWGANPSPVPANGGGTLLSDRRMAVYRQWFAAQAGIGMATSSLTTGGAAIEGVDRASVDEVIQLPIARPQITKGLGDLHRRSATDVEARTSAVLHAVAGIAAGMRDLDRLGQQALLAIRQQQRRPADTVELSALAEIDAGISNHAHRDIASFLMQDVIARIDNGYGSASVTEQLQASEDLYLALSSGASAIADALDRTSSSSWE